jgi:hypothetical protein
MGGIFISYRRLESSGYAGRISSQLAQVFGTNNIFMDVTGIGGARKFREVIDSALNSCDAFIAVIGPQWTTVTNEGGTPRIQAPNDHVRRELAAALARPDVDVVPVLVGDARMPGQHELPPDLAELRAWQAVQLSERHWNEDMGGLIQSLGGSVESDEVIDEDDSAQTSTALPLLAVALGLLVAAGPAYAAYKAGLHVKRGDHAHTVAHFAAGWAAFWAVLCAVVAAVVTAMGPDRNEVVPRAARGLLVGLICGGAGGIVDGLIRMNNDDHKKAAIVLGFAVTGALFGLSRIAGNSRTVGAVAGAAAGALGGVLIYENGSPFLSQALPAALILMGIAGLQALSTTTERKPAATLRPVQRL